MMKKGFGMSTSLFCNIAFFGCLILGGGMPEDPQELAKTHYWQVMYGVQIPILCLSIVLNGLVYTEDTIDFCIKKGDKQQAIRQIRNVYSYETPEVHEQIYQEKHQQHLDKMAKMGDTPDTLWHALTDKYQRWGSWVAIIISFFNAYSGIGIVQVFCVGIFEGILKLGAHSKFTTKE